MGTNVKKLSEEIRTMLMNALNKKGWHFFNNTQLSKCWEEMKCDNKQCPSYKSLNLRCWQVAGTFCEGEPQGEFVKKFGNCQKCKVYKKATQGDPILQIGEDFNNLMFHIKTKEDELRTSVYTTEEKNRELAALNMKIKRLLKKLDTTNVQLKELSIKDGLTELYNYRFFSKILREQYNLSKRYKFPLSIIMIDIDFFKAVNDTYGHQFGDTVLKQLSDILTKNVRDTDIVVRYGGEEFAILLPHTDQDDAYVKAERLRNQVSDQIFKIKGETLNITISLGIATYPKNKNIKQAERLVSYADKALYQAKENGRNRTVLFVGKTSLKRTKTPPDIKDMMERRKHPRIQTLIKIDGKSNKENLLFSNAFDISCSGLSVLSMKPIDINKTLKIEIYLEDLEGKTKSPRQIKVDGLVVRCRQINSIPFNGDTYNDAYLIGIQFINICHNSSMCLQKFFVSMFKKGCTE